MYLIEKGYTWFVLFMDCYFYSLPCTHMILDHNNTMTNHIVLVLQQLSDRSLHPTRTFKTCMTLYMAVLARITTIGWVLHAHRVLRRRPWHVCSPHAPTSWPSCFLVWPPIKLGGWWNQAIDIEIARCTWPTSGYPAFDRGGMKHICSSWEIYFKFQSMLPYMWKRVSYVPWLFARLVHHTNSPRISFSSRRYVYLHTLLFRNLIINE